LADVEVELTLLPTADGGRRSAAAQGYRPQFYYNNGDWDANYEYEVNDVPLGERVSALLTFFSPHEHRGKVFVGMPFLLREGNRVVGYGRVTALLDLETSALRAGREAEPEARRRLD
jgi:translation elongation factor EF-Tu-like GTPase